MSLRSRSISRAFAALTLIVVLAPLTAKAGEPDPFDPIIPTDTSGGDFSPAAIPEPASLSLLAIGAGALLLRRKK